jgi:hypothetical protein
MRYFLISFSHSSGDGNLTLQNETYPNFVGLIQTLKEQDPEIDNITILNILEMSEQDFEDFTE